MSGTPEAAIPELEKALTEHPDSDNAAVMLAHSYVKTGRAKEATALLEKRLQANPGNARRLIFPLGEAYLAVPEVDKAMEQYKKGLGEQPDPGTLDFVAYALAEAKARLTDAESYSNRAMTLLSVNTADLLPETAHLEAFQLMPELAKNWGTLGWIRFQQGDTEIGEKYLAASWELMQNPVVGEHLVEAYEKGGKRQQAAKVCAMSRAAYGHEEVDSKLSKEMDRLRVYLPKNPNSPTYAMPQDGSMALSDFRTMHVPFHTKLQGNSRIAHFVISLSPDSKDAGIAFVSGAEELRGANAALRRIKYPQTFPDNSKVHVLRKAVFSCSVYMKECVLLLMPVTDAAVPEN